MNIEPQTPETDAAMAKTVPWAALGELCKKLELEISETRKQLADTRYDVRVTSRLRKWLSMSDAEMRLQCGELSAQDVRNIRAILNEIYRRHE